ncbi:hypothetical protein GPECTOR_112g277 [Gonium pectorale]|uniref:EGF-like domain-containing protein n=1 Tax=Gonium pectorale TaxID=33097 RepID=A0A150FZ96_GONPE|nr:hypothetical protein GPECTOR_112g277 [Gonium pectorale]|eukprot:KXZ42907.1 hypothetical protein GPECTOR_112g277 [Gonium pectorale]
MHLTYRVLVLLAQLVTLLASFGANGGVLKKPLSCPAGCTERGNCNAETGRCECPWGYGGSCGNLWPKNCECYMLCQKMYCGSVVQNNFCTHELGRELPSARCWRHRDPAAPPTSLLPEEDDPFNKTVWYRHFTWDESGYKELEEEPSLWGTSNWSGGHKVHPLNRCPNRCSNGRGVCFRWGHKPEPECLCHKGYNGTDCSQVDNSEACWFAPDCGGRGTCRSGFCHCQPGYFGVGCHRSTAYKPAAEGTVPDVRQYTQLKIYMYDLPWNVAFPYEYNDGHHSRDMMYAAYEYFMQYFLNDTVVRTENPYEANLFYVPLLLYFYVGNVKDPVPHATRVLDYIRTNWPFYNRTGGRDHFYFMTGDRGTCHVPRWMQDECIKVVHFGMQKERLAWMDIRNQEYGCIQWLVSTGGHDGNRTLLFFFAGGVGVPGEYSGGVRQAIKRLLDSVNPKPPDVEFIDGRANNYRELLRKSKFCIAPYGFGWGLRLVQAMEFGCIPVIIQDWVYQAFEEYLPYEEFSVRMPLAGVGHLIEVLRSFDEQALAALRLGMARHYRAFIWNREWGGTAYEWTLAGLQRRLDNMRAEHFRRHRRRRGG